VEEHAPVMVHEGAGVSLKPRVPLKPGVSLESLVGAAVIRARRRRGKEQGNEQQKRPGRIASHLGLPGNLLSIRLPRRLAA
jgi:hypothetical protein